VRPGADGLDHSTIHLAAFLGAPAARLGAALAGSTLVRFAFVGAGIADLRTGSRDGTHKA